MKYQITLLFAFMTFGVLAQPIIIAHRGASYLAPENTVAAANLAWELGTDAVEVDVYLTKDKKVMVIHDQDTKRTCPGENSHVIKDTPSEVLRELDAGAWKDEKYKGEKIPFLAEIIETVPEGKKLVVEIKSGNEIIPYLESVVEDSGKQDQIIFIAFGWETILKTKGVFPGNECYWLSSVKEGLEEKMKQAANAGLEGINLNYKIVDKELVEKADKYNLDVLVWTVDNPEVAMKMKQAGVVAITTNRPKWLKEEMGKL